MVLTCSENCDFGYKCPLMISQLEYTSDTIRHCNKCEKDVFVVQSIEQLRQYVQLGRCVAFQPYEEVNSSVDAINCRKMTILMTTA
jgi:hypothetical protein